MLPISREMMLSPGEEKATGFAPALDSTVSNFTTSVRNAAVLTLATLLAIVWRRFSRATCADKPT